MIVRVSPLRVQHKTPPSKAGYNCITRFKDEVRVSYGISIFIHKWKCGARGWGRGGKGRGGEGRGERGGGGNTAQVNLVGPQAVIVQ